MNSQHEHELTTGAANERVCESVRAEFSDYLDGAVTGVEMAAISAHLNGCDDCSTEFLAWRNVQSALAQVGPVYPPRTMQARLRKAISEERARGSHLPWFSRLVMAWNSTIAPAALRVSGAVAMAVVLVAGLGWIFGAPIAVQANDEDMAHLVGPHYLYSQVPPQPIETKRDVPIVVEAKVDAGGRVYDYSIVEGPTDDTVKISVEQNLLASVFRPATLFGVPVKGHVVLTFTGVSVRG